jgi:hypothetical protein
MKSDTSWEDSTIGPHGKISDPRRKGDTSLTVLNDAVGISRLVIRDCLTNQNKE